MIPIERIGEYYLRVNDLIMALNNPSIIAGFEVWQLEQIRDSMIAEIERRKSDQSS